MQVDSAKAGLEIFAPHAVQDAITPTRTYSPIFMIAAVYLQVVSVQGQCAGAQHSRYFLNSSLLCLLLFVLLGMLDRKFSLEALSPGRLVSPKWPP